jgi:RHS repeat-associated protein
MSLTPYQAVTDFDAMLRPILSDSAIGSSVQSSMLVNYDARGQTIFASYPSGTALNFTSSPTMAGSRSSYDALGRLTQVQQTSELGTLTSSTAYLSGARQQVTDPKGNVTTTSYQVFDSPSYDAVTKVTAPEGINQTITRDVYGNPLSIRQYGSSGGYSQDLTKTLTYDSYHRLCRATEPESRSTVIAYDNANNLAWSAQGLAISGSGCGQEQVTAAAKTTRNYDVMNRVLSLNPPAGTQSTLYTYDALGHMATNISGINIQSYAYNARGLLTSEGLWIPSSGLAWTLGYSHDAYGNLATVSYPGESVAYAPDALGRATEAGNYAHGLQYFPNGSEANYTLGNGIIALVGQNTRQLTANLSYGLGANPKFSEDYRYDANGNITTVNDLINGQNNQNLGYDGLNRLTSASAPNAWGTETYAYDALNNLRKKLTGGYTFDLNVDANNRLVSSTVGGNVFASYVNSDAGNRMATNFWGTTTNYTFDAKNQLLGIPGVVSYAYDAAGRRVMKTPAAGGTAAASYSFYNQSGQLMYAYDAASGQSTNYVYLNGKLIARHAGSTVTYLLTDHLGSPVREADAAGNITASFSYRPYGSLATGPNQNQPGFTEHVNDPESGLVYMQARYYDPAVGRFLSVDPVGMIPGDGYTFNRYLYGKGNPILNIDPNGKFPLPSFLFQLDWLNEVVNKSAEENVVQPAKFAYKKFDENIRISATVGGAAERFGAVGEVDVLHLHEMSLAPVFGEGANVSVDVAPRHGLTFNIFGGSSEESNLKLSASAEAGDVFHAGISLSLDTNGNFSLTPKVGLGFGELMTGKIHSIPVLVVPQVKL